MKKVLYLAFNISHGKGGHFYSLRTTVEALIDEDIVPAIVIIGVQDSPVIQDSKIKKYFILFNGLNLIATFKQLKKYILEFSPDVIHAFDLHAFFWGRIISRMYALPLIVTKCGGKNLKYTPYAKNFIVYSDENLKYLIPQKKFRNTKFSLIPNRVDKIICNHSRINNLKREYQVDSTKKIFLRISRFVSAYEGSMIQAINLMQYYTDMGLDVQLIIIGEVQEEKSYLRIKNYSESSSNIFLITNSEYTTNASELIDIADCVIGTGRGLMEAASCGKVLFTPLKDSNYPAFVDEKNVSNFLKTNFSPRNKQNNSEGDTILKRSIKVINNSLMLKQYKTFSKEIFIDYFDINSSIYKYIDLYDNIQYTADEKYFDFLLHFFYILRSYFISTKKFQ